MSNQQVHWHEGLFLQPHHLQVMQRGLVEQRTAERRTLRSYPYGLIESKLAPDALENLLVRFDSLRAIMPSGVVVDFPGSADVPPLEIKQRFESSSKAMTILLGVPVWYASRANAIDIGSTDFRAKRIYRTSETEVADENTGENPQPVLVRRINARLMFDDDDRTDMETIPVMRVVHSSGDDGAMPRLDSTFVPPCYVIHGSPVLRELMRDLSNAVEAARRELVVMMTRAGFSVDTMRGAQFQQMLRLKTLNRFAAIMPSMVAAPATSSFEMYLTLRELLGELAALQPANDKFESAAYNHDEPVVAFMELAGLVRDMLRPVKGDRFRRLAFEREGPVFVATLGEDDLSESNEMFLGIKTKEDPRTVAAMVEDEDKFKLMAKTMWQSRIRGVKLAEERHPPVELPAESGLHYFRLMRAESQRMWDRISEERDMAVWWPDAEASDFAISLYMTVPQ